MSSESLHVVTPAYQPRDSSATVLSQVIAEHLETFLATLAADSTARGLPEYVVEEFYAYLQCEYRKYLMLTDFVVSLRGTTSNLKIGILTDVKGHNCRFLDHFLLA